MSNYKTLFYLNTITYPRPSHGAPSVLNFLTIRYRTWPKRPHHSSRRCHMVPHYSQPWCWPQYFRHNFVDIHDLNRFRKSGHFFKMVDGISQNLAAIDFFKLYLLHDLLVVVSGAYHDQRSTTHKFVTPTALSCIDNIIYIQWSSRRYDHLVKIVCWYPII